MKKIAINGFGRIGRCALRQLVNREDFDVVAINALSDSLQLAYLYKYDSVHGMLESSVSYDDENIIVNGKKIRVFNEKDPENLPWKKLDIDIVLECTGIFTSKEGCMHHIKAGAKKVLLSAPAKDDMKTIVYGVNDDMLTDEDTIISCSSCTTNCLVPVVYLLNKEYGVIKGFMSTIHAITNDQRTLDGSHKKGIESRRGRSSSFNIIPTTTGAASQVGRIIPSLNGLLDGIAYRVPVQDGSLIDLTVELKSAPTIDEINLMFKQNQSDTLKIINSPIVSSDIIGNDSGAVVDAALTDIVEENGKVLAKVVAWYDNEWGYTAQMIRTLAKM